MTLTRLSLLSLALISFSFTACGTKETGDTAPDADADTDSDADTDTDTDTDTTDYFEPYYWMMVWQFGWANGDVKSDVSYDGTAVGNWFSVIYAEEEYYGSWEDRYTCSMDFEATYTKEALDPGYEIGAVAALGAVTTDCELDPALWGDDPTADWMADYGIVAGAFTDPQLSQGMSADELAVTFGGDFFMDDGAGNLVSVASQIGYEQSAWGMAYPVGADGALDPNGQLAVADLAGRQAGYVIMQSAFIFGFGK